QKLLDEKLITPWQHQHLVEGRTKGYFLGKYKLLNFLGSGGMSTVYLAEHVMMKRRVAIKVLMEAQVDAVTLERFRHECRAVAALDHRHIVRAHDFDSDGKFHYLVMEYVKGGDLEGVVRKQGPLSYRLAAEFARQAAEGLAYAHDHGLVHRDMKPSNLLLSSTGVVKVLDMGVAKIADLDHNSLTVHSNQNLLGTVDYLAPEQAIDSHAVDPRADVYSLGCTLYYFLTGSPPYASGSQAQRLLSHQISPVPNIRAKRADIPQMLLDVLHKMLAKKPEDRYQNCREVAAALQEFLDYEAAAPPPPSSHVIEASRQQAEVSETDTRSKKDGGTVAVKFAMIKVSCPTCNSNFGAPAQAAHRRVKCPHCGGLVFIPSSSSEGQPQS
ncbi:MAG TPA: serine/threonine-protein kinase, partial [Pirellulales bacterium]